MNFLNKMQKLSDATVGNGMSRIFKSNFYTKALLLLGILQPIYSEAALLKILSTEPDTKVFEVTDPMNKKELGRTPLTLTDFDTSQPRILLIEKPGYASVYLPFSKEVATHFSIKADMHPLINWTSEELNRKTVEIAEAVLDKITAVQTLLDTRKVKEALTLIESLKNEFPNSFSVRLVYANALLLNGEGQKADAMYASLISEVPTNKAYLKSSLEQIHSRLGNKARMPASTGGN